MSVPCSFEGENLLGKPDSMSVDECEPLPVCVVTYPDGMMGMVSCWKLTHKELEEINKTGRIWLTILGSAHPPVIISGKPEFLP